LKPPTSPLFPYTTLFRAGQVLLGEGHHHLPAAFARPGFPQRCVVTGKQARGCSSSSQEGLGTRAEFVARSRAPRRCRLAPGVVGGGGPRGGTRRRARPRARCRSPAHAGEGARRAREGRSRRPSSGIL